MGEISRDKFAAQEDRLRVENTAVKDELEFVDKSIFNTKVHLEMAAKILRDDGLSGRVPGLALVANQVLPSVNYREVSAFEQATMLTAASRVYSILDNPELEALKQKALQQMMWNSDQTPLSLRAELDDKQRQQAGDVLAQFLLTRVKRLEINSLIEGKTRFQDLGIETEVADLIERCIQNAIPLAHGYNSEVIPALQFAEL